jgi:predicted N-formylglutamate amidohydrolase
MGKAHAANDCAAPVRVSNEAGRSPFLILCDHASHRIPAEYGTLGLTAEEQVSHIAWDPGALPVSQFLADRLDATLIESCVSRLIADCNRPLDVRDLVPEVSERTVVPGNRGLTAAERRRRIAAAHAPSHIAVERIVESGLG